MEIKRVPISQVEPWDKNPRNIKTKDFERLKKQILELGIYKPLICYKEGDKYITLGGNMRLLALRELGIPEVEISIVHPKSEAEKIKYNLSDNDRAGEYDDQALAELIYPHQDEIQLEDFKVDLGEAIDLKGVIDSFGPELEDFEEEEIPEIDDGPAVTQPGDLYQLGRHRLLCGDATKEEDVKRLMNGEEIDVILTDPPYGIDIVKSDGSVGYGGELGFIGARGIVPVNRYPKIKGDDKPFDPGHLLKLCKNCIIFGGNYFASKLPDKACWLVWDKREHIPSNNFADCELVWTSFDTPARIYRHLWSGLLRKGGRQDELTNRVHPTQKPVGLISRILEDFSKEGDKILDPYLGSGSTLIACEKTNRVCYGIEIEPRYCDLVIKRFADYVGISEEEIRATRETS